VRLARLSETCGRHFSCRQKKDLRPSTAIARTPVETPDALVPGNLTLLRTVDCHVMALETAEKVCQRRCARPFWATAFGLCLARPPAHISRWHTKISASNTSFTIGPTLDAEVLEYSRASWLQATTTLSLGNLYGRPRVPPASGFETLRGQTRCWQPGRHAESG
jgi:hypothetical protein